MMGVTYLSELTYPLYLLHSVIQLHWTRLTGSMRFADAFLDVAVLLVAASLLHLAIERPFLALRNRSDARSTAPAPTWQEPSSPRAAPPTVPGSAAPRRGRPTSMIEKPLKKRPPGSRS
jgi:peptidoglycan/LPS O-acetylase OafA/YrhL